MENIIDERFVILHKYFKSCNEKRRDEAIVLLENRDFKNLRKNYSSWIITERVKEIVEHTDVQKLIEQLQFALVNIKHNQSIPTLNKTIIQEEEQWADGVDIYLESYLYSIKSIESCGTSAFHFAKSCLWKINNQPNGTDTKMYLKIIEDNQ